MSCPRCGDDCRCSSAHERDGRTSVLIDPDAYDPSEQQFAATLESAGTVARSVNVLGARPAPAAPAPPPPTPSDSADVDDSWRDEVASRVHAYRRRRRRYDPANSLSLDFGPSLEPPPPPVPQFTRSAPAEQPKIIEFPKPAPPPLFEELADPILDRPRILEAEEHPDPALPPAAILLDEETEPAVVVSELGLPLRPAPVGQRTFAALVDWAIVLMASGVFTMIFLKLANELPRTRFAAGLAMLIPCFFWGAYQYIFLVHAATTPGMQMAELGMETFDGGPMTRRLRRWRALAMLISCMSVGLGFVWAMVDEDELCWHDRITRTYVSQS